MHAEQDHPSVDIWLSRLPPTQPLLDGLPLTPPSAHSSPSTPNISSIKRKRSDENENENAICKRLRPGQPLTREALCTASGNMGGDAKEKQAQDQASADPTENDVASLSPSTLLNSATSSELLVKQSKNVANIRHSLAKHGMWFNNTDSLEACPEFKEKVYKIFEKERASRMQEPSFKKIKTFMEKNSTANEATLFGGLIDPIIKSERTVQGKKRNAEGEILFVCRSFEDDDMVCKRDLPFVKGFLPGRMDKKTESQLGLTDPKPDWTFGIRRNEFPLPGTLPSERVETIMGVADGMIHPFFVIENKGCDASIEVARNQAIRDGAVIVNARIHLNALAQEDGWQKVPGADMDAFAFSCTWDANMSELWIHWHQTREDGVEIFQMNQLGQYFTWNQEHLAQFRHDIHNILDWGTLTNKRNCEAVVQEIIRKEKHARGKQGGKGGSGTSGKSKAGSTAGPKD